MTTLSMPRPVRTLAIAFTVWGEPIPQGSMVAFASRNPGQRGVATLKASNEAVLKPWRRAVAKAAGVAIAQSPSARRPLLDGPLVARLVFTFDRPKTVSRTMPCVRPDADKLLRACFDSCTTANLWADDGRIVEALVRKVYVGQDPEALPRPGVRIAVWTLNEAAQPTLDEETP